MNVGFVSTRLAGNDGVTLETRKWAQVCRRMGYQVFFCAGQLDADLESGWLIPEAHFTHPEIAELQLKCFGVRTRAPETTDKIHELRRRLKVPLRQFIEKHSIDVLIAENAVTIPMNIPLGLALAEVIVETGLPTVAHHHDFFWERQRFLVNCVPDFLDAAFPPDIPCIKHVVINTPARKDLAQRKGVPSSLVPNVFDFDAELPASDEYAQDLREQIGLKPDDFLILQPTRIVSRKGIEHAIELVRRLNEPRAKLVISHSAGDEGMDYYKWLQNVAQCEGVDIKFIANRLNEMRKFDENGNKIYTLWDVYRQADLITYPSTYEGFGNAFLEAVYFRKPILVNRYEVYMVDIEPLGFDTIAMNGYLTDATVSQVRFVLADAELRKKMTDHNYEIGRKHFSLDVLERKLKSLLAGAEPTLEWAYA